jgi:exonuclease VII large subunit
MEVANWFAQAQSQLRQAKAQGMLQKGQDLANLSKQLLQQAQNQMLATQQEATNRRSMLDQWALNNSQTITQAKQNLASTSNYQAPGIVNPGIQGQLTSDARGNIGYNPGTGYGSSNTSSDWLKKLYGTA